MPTCEKIILNNKKAVKKAIEDLKLLGEKCEN
jgi:hypothetical protein